VEASWFATGTTLEPAHRDRFASGASFEESTMFVGHLGLGLALASRSPRYRLGALLGAVMLLDVLLGVFVLAGWERIIVPPDFAVRHFLEFEFPWSHGLISALAWSLVVAAAGGAGWLPLGRGAGAAWAAGLAVASHWPCDALEHVRGLPLLGPGSPHIGFGLWSAMPRALAVEMALLVVGAALFLGARRDLPRSRIAVLVVALTVFAALQIAAQSSATSAPAAATMAMSWIGETVLLVALGLWVDRSRA
jgi:hypothetical protein